MASNVPHFDEVMPVEADWYGMDRESIEAAAALDEREDDDDG